MKINRTTSFIIASIWILAGALQLSAQNANDLFNGDVLHEVRLWINPTDFATLKATNFICPAVDKKELAGEFVPIFPNIECHFAVEFHWKFQGRDITTAQGSVSSHGLGSRSNIKPSFKIDFARYESEGNFLGLKSLVLRANTQDASMMHERIAMTFYRLLGIAAPREVHTRLYLNDQYVGVYTIVEDIDPDFIQRNLGESGGYLYGFDYKDPWFFEYRGSDFVEYSPQPLKPENHIIDRDPSPIEAMVKTINQAPDAQFSSAVGQYLDLNAFFRELAAENFVADQDSINGDYGMNNFYLYRFQNTVKSIFLPWDKSNAFWAADWAINHNITANMVPRRASKIAPELMAIYKSTLQKAADLAGGPGGLLEQEVLKESNQIRSSVYEDRLKLCDQGATGYLHPCSNDEFEAEVAYLVQFARTRANFVRNQLAAGIIP